MSRDTDIPELERGPHRAPSVTPPPPSSRATGTGILLLIASLLAFSLMDAAAKHLQQTYPMTEVIWARFAINFALVCLFYRGSLGAIARTRQPVLQSLRGVCQLLCIALFFLSIQHIGLAEASALFEINPVLVTLGAALFLGEKIGPRRIVAIGVAFLGALIILRPGVAPTSVAALLALLSAVAYAVSNLLTRGLREEGLATSLIWASGSATLLCTLLLPFGWREVAMGDMPLFLLVGLLGTVGQVLVIRAFISTEAGTLAPFDYTGLIFSGLWGWVFFSQLPDRFTVLGALVIAGAGLYVWHRERKHA